MPDAEITEETQIPGQNYRFERLAMPLVMRDMFFSKGDPRPGDQTPEFDLPTLGGHRFRSTDLGETGPAVLVFGSYTCPVTDGAAPGLNELHNRFGDRIRFVMVNVREAHPGKAVTQPQTIEEKTGHAELLRNIHGFNFDVAVDDIDGTLHRAFGPKPNSAYVLSKDGTILFRTHWANDTKALAEALEAIAADQAPKRSQSGGLLPMMRIVRNVAPVLDRAGSGAWGDMWRAALPMAALALALKALGVRPRNPEAQPEV